MVDSTGDALREIADMVDGLKEVCRLESRNELEAIRNRLRHLAQHEQTLSQDVLRVMGDDEEGVCDRCGSRLVWRGRNPSSLRCPLGCADGFQDTEVEE